jgi:hypothetical protein
LYYPYIYDIILDMSRIELVPKIVVDRKEFPRPPRRGSHITTPEDKDFFEGFLSTLAEYGFENDDVVFRGFDGDSIKRHETNPEAEKEHIWVMSAGFWRWSLESTATAAAIGYAEKYETPCVGIYDLHQLRVDEEHLPSQPLSDLRGSAPGDIFHKVTHIDYPRLLPAAALQALVFFEYAEE